MEREVDRDRKDIEDKPKNEENKAKLWRKMTWTTSLNRRVREG